MSFGLWLIVAVIILGAGIYRIGAMNERASVKNDAFWLTLTVSVLWPLVLIFAIIAGPFAGLYWLGERKRKKLKKEESTNNK
jgi:chromate transport protein ChrA